MTKVKTEFHQHEYVRVIDINENDCFMYDNELYCNIKYPDGLISDGLNDYEFYVLRLDDFEFVTMTIDTDVVPVSNIVIKGYR